MAGMIRRRAALVALPTLSWVLSGCGGGASPPTIARFSASPERFSAGQAVTLTAEFQDGEGEIDGGVGRVQSGVPVTVTPADDATYTLTVRGGSTEVSAQVSVQLVLALEFDFSTDGAQKWEAMGGTEVELRDGCMLVASDEFTDPEQCGGDGWSSVWLGADPKYENGEYGPIRITVVFDQNNSLTIDWGYGDWSGRLRLGEAHTVQLDLTPDAAPTIVAKTMDGHDAFFSSDAHGDRQNWGGSGLGFVAEYFCGPDGGTGTSGLVRSVKIESL